MILALLPYIFWDEDEKESFLVEQYYHTDEVPYINAYLLTVQEVSLKHFASCGKPARV